jgi:hypothetical protein
MLTQSVIRYVSAGLCGGICLAGTQLENKVNSRSSRRTARPHSQQLLADLLTSGHPALGAARPTPIV